jgi:GAF domain-containing protein
VIAGARINGHETEAAVVSPISLRGEVIGTLSLQDIDPDRRWTAEEVALIETVTEQLALTVENLRLFDDTQMRASREYLTRQIADKMRQAPDVDTIINTGLTELAKALGVSRTYVKLGAESKPIDTEIETIRNQLKSNGQHKQLPAAPAPSAPGDGADHQDQPEERE